MRTSFSPSLNIIQDIDRQFNYIPTPNSKRAFDQILNSYDRGIHSFNIIGSYGTGKSAFLLAFERNLSGKQIYFKPINGQFKGMNNFKFVNIIGEYNSIIDTFAHRFKVPSCNKNNAAEVVLDGIDKQYREIKKGESLVIVIDELGKYLEYAANNNSEKELYFIQQLAEYVNGEDRNILLLTTLHQNFNTYAQNLSITQRQEWEKVKGRLKEITFNENVEQLLYLASEHIYQNRSDKDVAVHTDKIAHVIDEAKLFPIKSDSIKILANKLFPFDVMSASVLTLALQQYGQNERSLFTFLRSNDHLGLEDYTLKTNPYYNLSCVYDYLIYHYYYLLSTKYNPHYIQWSSIKNAIERTEMTIAVGDVAAAVKIVKSIGLLNIFGTSGSRIDENILGQYSRECLGIKNYDSIIHELDRHKIIRYINFKKRYILFEGTDLDIELAISEASSKIEPVTDVVGALKKRFSFPYILAKAAYYKFGAPRFYEFQFSDTPIIPDISEEIDGVINIVFSEKVNEKEIMAISKQSNDAVLYGLYRNTRKIKDLLCEIDKINSVIKDNPDDFVAIKELKSLLSYNIEELNKAILDSLLSEKVVSWYFKGKEKRIRTTKEFNQILSHICEEVYCDTPVFVNELINRHSISSAISTALKKMLKALVDNGNQDDLGFSNDEFPPEKSIYLALIKETGMHIASRNGYILGVPKDHSFKKLWNTCEEFLHKAKRDRRQLTELVDLLRSKPIKMKQGFINFWIPVFLYIRRDNFALFNDNIYVPFVNTEVLELIVKNPDKFELKSFNIEGVKLDLFNKYRELINQDSTRSVSNSTFIETIRPFLSFYRGLPEYAKQTKKLSKSARLLRKAIEHSSDPEKTFFEDFPDALGFEEGDLRKSEKVLKSYIVQLQTTIKEIRNCYDELISRIEQVILKSFGYGNMPFAEYKAKIKERYSCVKEHMLLPYQKAFYNRLFSNSDDRNAWISSIVQAVLDKPLEKLLDEEENVVLEKLESVFKDIDNLCEIIKAKRNDIDEEAIKIEVTSIDNGIQKQIVHILKSDKTEINKVKKEIVPLLTKNKKINIKVLIELIQNEINND